MIKFKKPVGLPGLIGFVILNKLNGKNKGTLIFKGGQGKINLSFVLYHIHVKT